MVFFLFFPQKSGFRHSTRKHYRLKKKIIEWSAKRKMLDKLKGVMKLLFIFVVTLEMFQ